MKIAQKRKESVRRMVMIAMFTAMAYVAMLVIHIKVGFLTMDVKDAVITLCGLYFGPVSALFISIAVPLLELISVSTTGAYGLIMNILGSVSFSVTASGLYRWKKTLRGAIVALLSGALLMTAVMLIANLFITPLFLGTPREAVEAMIPTLLLPFNLLKATVNVGVVLLLYKPLSKALRRLGILSRGSKPAPTEHVVAEDAQNSAQYATKSKKMPISLLVLIAALVLIVGSLVLIFTVLGGKFDFGV